MLKWNIHYWSAVGTTFSGQICFLLPGVVLCRVVVFMSGGVVSTFVYYVVLNTVCLRVTETLTLHFHWLGTTGFINLTYVT